MKVLFGYFFFQEKVSQSIFPVSSISAVSAVTGAVSQRRMRGPMEHSGTPSFAAMSASKGSKPPSGPVMMAAFLGRSAEAMA